MRRLRLTLPLAAGLLACAAEDPAGGPDAGPAPAPDAGVDAGEADAGPAVDAGAVDAGPNPLDTALAEVLAELAEPVAPLSPLPAGDPELVALGELLFFDPILSGNKDTACATCHQAESASADGLPLALGTGARGRGPDREIGDATWARRHTPDLWNRGRLETLFWDGRVSTTSTASGPPLPGPLADPLAIQALHPILDPREMLGAPGDVAVDGAPNELAGGTPGEVYAALEARLAAVEGYRTRFEALFGPDGVSLANALAALAAFQRARFDPTDTPWDRYLAGDAAALGDAAKLGAIVFFGAGRCGDCHSGPLLSDGEFHNIGVPLLDPIDEGRAAVDPAGTPFAFRTPPLRNTAASPPFMHNGTMADLQDVLRHYSNPERTAASYDGEGLPPELAARIVTDEAELARLTSALSEDLPLAGTGATPVGLSNIRQFLLHLVDDSAIEQAGRAPESVPSGLAVGGL